MNEYTQENAIVDMIYDKLMDNKDPLKVELINSPALDQDNQTIYFEYEGRDIVINIKVI